MKLAVTFILITALLTACGKNEHSMNHSGAKDSMAGMNHNNGHMDTAQEESVEAVFTLSRDKPEPNQDTTITVQIQAKDGKAIDDFDVKHEKKMHVIIVSKDLSYFNHIHPEYNGKNEFHITTRFPTAGEFEIIADFAPTGIGSMSRSQWIKVNGNAPAAKPIEPDPTLTKVMNGKEVTLSFDHLMANMEITLNFNLKDAKTKEPITDLQPYLGAVGHVVILNQEGGEYLHVHPVEEKSSGPDAQFKTSFPHSGVYKIWGQFQQNGEVVTIPFVVHIP